MRDLFNVFFICIAGFVSAQTIELSGVVKDKETHEALYGVAVRIAESSDYAVTDENGRFVLKGAQKYPVVLRLSILGYQNKTIEVTNATPIEVVMKLATNNLDAVVLSASRLPERIFESPIAVERMGKAEIENTTSPSFYGNLENLKGVDLNTSSLLFQSVNTRGFSTFGNIRFVQLIDGMDSASPGLNFPIGNIIGTNQLDIHSVELLPGASSALYGANAFNGILLMKSKNPFAHTGTSVYGKTGITSSGNGGVHPFWDAGFRFAKKVSHQFAVKLTGSYLKATDWLANDTRSIQRGGAVVDGNRQADLAYDGVNIFGDEVATNLNGIGRVSRTGYTEQDLSDRDTDNFKISLSLHFRPFGKKSEDEFVWTSNVGTGNILYQGASRYALRNFILQQHKLEFTNKHITLRGYTTSEHAGDSYDIRFAGINLNRNAKSDRDWFTDFALAYGGAFAHPVFAGTDYATIEAGNHVQARALADSNLLNTSNLTALQQAVLAGASRRTTWNRNDSNRFVPRTQEFRQALSVILNDSDVATGARFVDNSRFFHGDMIYSFKEQIPFVDFQMGALFRKYVLDSDGTLYTDIPEAPITYQEFGIYGQFQKEFMEDRLKLTGSIRYDKSENFKGRFTPRASLLYVLGGDKNHNLRVSYQTAFRNPTTQEQYIGLDIETTILVGAAKDNLDRNLPGTDLTLQAILAQEDIRALRQEKVSALELGYRGKWQGLQLDLSAYRNHYKDFVAQRRITIDEQRFNIFSNSLATITSYGLVVGADKNIFENYHIGVNYTYADFEFDNSLDSSFTPNFNTSRHKVKISIANPYVYKNIGFGINARWQDAYTWNAAFADAKINARTIVDAQCTYRMPKINSIVKIGGTNILQHDYLVAPGAGVIGSQFFGSWTYNF